MKSNIIFAVCLTAVLIAPCTILGSPSSEKLHGKWKCIREHDSAKIVGGYMKEIEFTPDEIILDYEGSSDGPFHCKYTVTGNYIHVEDLKTHAKWKFDYTFLKNGDLYLHKDPWNWEGWFSRDFSRPRIEDPRDPKNISDQLRKQRSERTGQN